MIWVKNTDQHIGKSHTLSIYGNSIASDMNLPSGKMVVQFVVANKREIVQWNTQKNTVKYNLMNSAVANGLQANRSNPTQYHALKRDWEKLLERTKKLNQSEYDAALNAFKTKYGL